MRIRCSGRPTPSSATAGSVEMASTLRQARRLLAGLAGGLLMSVVDHDPAAGGRAFRRERREGMPDDRRQTDRAGLRAIARAASGRQAAKLCSSLPDRCHSCRPGLHPADGSAPCRELPQHGRPPDGSGVRSKPRAERRRPTGPLRRAVPVVDLLGGAGMRMALGRGDSRGGRPIDGPDTCFPLACVLK